MGVQQMENKLVSIIIPVYNSGKKLNHCIESLLSQTYDNIEIIIVDDKSLDQHTIQLEKEWIEKGSAHKVAKKCNKW